MVDAVITMEMPTDIDVSAAEQNESDTEDNKTQNYKYIAPN